MAYAGFDRADCPSLDMMARLKADTNLEWVGFYLPAPSQRGATWKGKRAALVAQGWGLTPIYVGQQLTGPGARNTSSAQGATDGADAFDKMKAEGFARGSWVYLDLENGPPFTMLQKGYVAAWVDTVESFGYRAGVYCSYLFAGEVKALCPTARIWVFHLKVAKIAAHLVDGLRFPELDPANSGFAGAVIWQFDDEARLSVFGDLACDLDSSTMRDPSAPAAVASTPTRPPGPYLPPPSDVPSSLPIPAPANETSSGMVLAYAGIAIAIVAIAVFVYFAFFHGTPAP